VTTGMWRPSRLLFTNQPAPQVVIHLPQPPVKPLKTCAAQQHLIDRAAGTPPLPTWGGEGGTKGHRGTGL